VSVKRKQHSSDFKARVAMAVLSGEKTLAELSSEFAVHPTMISTWKQELMKRASELFERANKAPAVDDTQKVIDDLHRKIGQLQVERDFLAGQPAISRLVRGGRGWPKVPAASADGMARRGDDRAERGSVRQPAMHAARDRPQQLLLPTPAGVGGGA
jgi:transposase